MIKLPAGKLPFLLTVLLGSLLVLAFASQHPTHPDERTSAVPKTTLKTITLRQPSHKGMEDTGKLRRLAAVLQQYLKHDEVRLYWVVPQAAEYGFDEYLIYNRRTKSLRYESWWSNFCGGQTFDHVSENAIQSAGKEAPQLHQTGLRSENERHWVRALVRRGGRLITSFQN